MISIRRMTSLEDMIAISRLEAEVWGAAPIPTHQTYTAASNGGIVLGAYERDALVGFLYSFPGYKQGKIYLCSHMMGIAPAYRSGGLGARLKEKQRELALLDGYDSIFWTYDPLESPNAYLNLHKLGGIAVRYHENYYGEIMDELNRSLPSDRFLVEWKIRSRHVADRKGQAFSVPAAPCLLETEPDSFGDPVPLEGSCAPAAIASRELGYTVPFPDGFRQIKNRRPDLALAWRLVTRRIFGDLFAAGYVASDVTRSPQSGTCHYLFVKQTALMLEEPGGDTGEAGNRA